MEWPEMIENILPDDTTKVTIEEDTDGSRRIVF
jgi:tRNA threonylcarbamoyladenosine biosynthesis protein TsaE